MGKRGNHVLHQLGCRQDHGLRTPVPAVAGTESLLEEGLLVVDAGLLVQGSEVPEDPHINNADSTHKTGGTSLTTWDTIVR